MFYWVATQIYHQTLIYISLCPDDRSSHRDFGGAVSRLQRDVQHRRRRCQHVAPQADPMIIRKKWHFLSQQTVQHIKISAHYKVLCKKLQIRLRDSASNLPLAVRISSRNQGSNFWLMSTHRQMLPDSMAETFTFMGFFGVQLSRGLKNATNRKLWLYFKVAVFMVLWDCQWMIGLFYS